MKYSEYVDSLRKWIWTHQDGKIVGDKNLNRQLATSLEIPVPIRYELPEQFVLKPSRGCGGAGVIFGDDSFLLEERIIDEAGISPARVFHLYFFNNRFEFVQIAFCHSDKKESQRTQYKNIYGYYDKEWNPLDLCNQKLYLCSRPASFDDMIKYGERFSREFTSQVVRVDFFASNRGAIYNECCLTPGLLSRITEEWDLRFGSLIKPTRRNPSSSCQIPLSTMPHFLAQDAIGHPECSH